MNYGWPRDMTAQEAEALVARLTRVWEPDEGTIRCVVKVGRHLIFNCRINKSPFQLFISSTSSTARLYERDERGTPGFRGTFFANETRYHCLSEADRNFAAEWMPCFRRGCWLSGLPIEATAHEKAEWMQGLTREEVQAWNLKM